MSSKSTEGDLRHKDTLTVTQRRDRGRSWNDVSISQGAKIVESHYQDNVLQNWSFHIDFKLLIFRAGRVCCLVLYCFPYQHCDNGVVSYENSVDGILVAGQGCHIEKPPPQSPTYFQTPVGAHDCPRPAIVQRIRQPNDVLESYVLEVKQSLYAHLLRLDNTVLGIADFRRWCLDGGSWSLKAWQLCPLTAILSFLFSALWVPE